MRAKLAGMLLAGMCALPALGHGALSDRIAILGDRIKGHPDNASLRLERAELLRQDEAFDAALADLDAAEKQAPAAGAYPLLRGQVLMDAGRFARAAREVGPFTEANPKLGPAWWLLGQAHLRAGDFAKAADALDRAVALMDPLQPDHVLAQAKAHAAAGQTETALRHLEAGMAKLGNLPALVEQAVASEVALGRKEAALRRLDAVIAQWRGRGLKTAGWEELRGKVAG
jgi:tetratricopeptide (TPR) repeat protein